jgi:hypothetical protein
MTTQTDPSDLIRATGVLPRVFSSGPLSKRARQRSW